MEALAAIVRLYGTVTFNNQILSVSAWMEMGNVMTYTSILGPAKDRFGILIDVASGLEYLHQNHIMHGNLRGANVLIDANGRALISDTGLSMSINEVSWGLLSLNDNLKLIEYKCASLYLTMHRVIPRFAGKQESSFY